MSKKAKRKIKQEEREAKIEEDIRNGKIIRVRYEDRRKKLSLPNHMSIHKTSEEEMEDRQETAEKAVKVYHKMLSVLIKKLSGIKDPRESGRIKHKMTVLFIYGILLSMYHIGSRREGNKILSKPVFFENLKVMFPEIETMPHADTLARLLKRLEVSEIEQCMIEMLKDLIRSKKFRNYLIKKRYLIAIDGTQKLYRDYCISEKALVRHVGGEARIPQYYCYVLEAVLVLDNGIVLPVMSEFIENGIYKKVEDKQDCERRGFYRLAKRLKEAFRNSKISIVVDGLYACGPVITVCRKYGWDYMIVFKKDCIPNVWKEALALMKINPENRLECRWGDRKQIYAWTNEIEYEYMLGKKKIKETLNVVICFETWQENHSRTTGKVEKKSTQYAWLSSREISHDNVFFRCTRMGRYRWKIENNILVEKHQGYQYEHCFSYDWHTMKGFHYLMKIGHLVNVLAMNSEILTDKVRSLGIRGFVQYLKLICEGSPLDEKKIKEAREEKFMWRLELVA